jgi:epoxyqueuosine reductase
MKVLLHICCGPCAIYPVKSLRQEGHEVAGFFYNPNIHPFSEYERRYQAVVAMSERLGLDTIYHRYDFEDFLKNISVLSSRDEQHRWCWRVRLEETAKMAKQEGFEGFTTTLLSSPYQDISIIAALSQELACSQQLTFVNQPFRKGFAESHKAAKEWMLYHQNYCGCLYSEKESLARKKHV